MGTVSDKLIYLNGTKTALKDVLVDNGKMISDSDTFRSYATKFDEKFDELNTIIEDTFVEETKEGTSIDIDDALNYKSTLEVKGNTEQVQLSGKNLFNKNSILIGYRIGTTGQDYEQANYFISDFIKVSPNTTYTKNSPNADDYHRFAFYESNNQESYISKVDDDNTATTPATCNYLRFSGKLNELNTTQLEEGSTATPYEPYCGGVPSPNPDYPQEIQNVEGRSCTNLVGGEWFNGLYNADGSISNVNRNYRSFRVQLKAGTYVYSYLSNIELTTVRSVNISENSSFSIANKSFTLLNDAEISLGFRKTDNSEWNIGENLADIEFQLEKGTTATKYEPYFEGKRLELNVYNKNLIYGEIESGYFDSTTGQKTTNSSYYRNANSIRVKPNTNYIFSINGSGSNINVYAYKKDMTFIGRIGDSYISSGNYFTTPNDCYYINVFRSTGGGNEKWQVEEGTTISDYEANKQQTLLLNLNGIELCRIGEYQDYFYKENGKWYLHKEIQKKTLNGRESWSTRRNDDYYYNASIDLEDAPSTYRFTVENADIISNKFSIISYTDAYNLVKEGLTRFSGVAASANKRLYLTILKSRLTYVSTWANALKDWLSSNNVILYYGLEVPTTTEITDTTLISQLEALAKVVLYKGINHIWTNTDGLEPNLILDFFSQKQYWADGVKIGYTRVIPNVDFSRLTDFSYMFYSIKSEITEIPNKIDTSNATTIYAMFCASTSLVTAPSLDTSKATNCSIVFRGCSALVNVPVYNCPACTSQQNMFQNCPNLSNEALNNILATCLTMTSSSLSSSKKTLAYIGLSEEQATTCTGLSNWEALSEAGWSTGY